MQALPTDATRKWLTTPLCLINVVLFGLSSLTCVAIATLHLYDFRTNRLDLSAEVPPIVVLCLVAGGVFFCVSVGFAMYLAYWRKNNSN